MKKEQKEQVLNNLKEIIENAFKKIDVVNNYYFLAIKKELKQIDLLESKSNNFKTLNETYQKKQDCYKQQKYYIQEIENALKLLLDNILIVFFENVKNNRDKSEFEKMFEWDSDSKKYPLNVYFRFYTSDHNATIYLTLNNTDHYKKVYYFSKQIIESKWNGNEWKDIICFENFSTKAEELKEAIKKVIDTKVLNNSELKKEFEKVEAMQKEHKKQLNDLLAKQKQESEKVDIYKLSLLIGG